MVYVWTYECKVWEDLQKRLSKVIKLKRKSIYAARDITGLFVGLLLLGSFLGAASASAKTVEIVYWDEEHLENQRILDVATKQFMQKNPDIKVKRHHYSTEDLRMQFQTATMGGGGPDLVLAPNDFSGVFGVMGTIQTVQKWGKMERFHDVLITAISDEHGNAWGIPITRGNHLVLFVNRKLMPKAPATLEELIAETKQGMQKGKFSYGLVFHMREPYWFVPFLGAYGSKPLVSKKPNLKTPAMEKALALIHSLKFKHRIMPESCDYSCAETLFLENKAPAIINGDWAIGKYNKALGKDLIISPLPVLKATGRAMTPMSSGKYFMLNRKLKGEKLAAAKKLLEFFVSKQTQIFLAMEAKRLPVLKSLAKDKMLTGEPLIVASEAAIKNSYPMPNEVQMRVVWDAIRPQLQNVLAGRGTFKQAAAIMQKDAEEKIANMMR